ncbi:hypothetical protein [Stutzerimonas stutzeri]|nr:hypothetical protein [Stutzerimonas stutzeri]
MNWRHCATQHTDLQNDRDRRAVNDLLERINRLHDELAPLALLPIPAKS